MIYVWIPALTFCGALLFFAAGLLMARASRLAPASPPLLPVFPSLPLQGVFSPSPGRPDEVDLESVDLHTDPDQVALIERVTVAEAEARAVRSELQQQVLRAGELQHDLDEMAEQLVRVQRQAAAPTGGRVRRSTPPPFTKLPGIGPPTSPPPTAPPPIPSSPSPAALQAELESERVRTRAVERQLIDLQNELVQTPEADVVAALRRDLMVAREQAQSRQEMADRAAAENAQQKALLADLGWMREEVELLRSENAKLRTMGLIMDMDMDMDMQAPKRPRSVISVTGADGGAASGPRPFTNSGGFEIADEDLPQTPLPTPTPTGPSRAAAPPPPSSSAGSALQALVDELAEHDQVRAVVVADERGLVVAANGGHSDQMAAVGALLGRAAAQVGRLLPIGNPDRVVVKDEHQLTITVRPFDAEGGKLSLVTLALGDLPDQQPAEPAE